MKKTNGFFKRLFAYNCLYCGKAALTESTVFCEDCETAILFSHPEELGGVITVLDYNSKICENMILCMKDYKLKKVHEYAAHLLANELKRREIPDLSEYYITFAPRNMKSRFKKGFDQSHEIGKLLSKELFGTKSRCKTLFIGSLFSKEQKMLTSEERKENVSKNIHLLPYKKIPSKLIILDDITTTGSTLHHLRDKAISNGAEKVLLCAIARNVITNKI